MPRQPRVDIAGEIYHVLNRANARLRIFKTEGDYHALLNVLEETLKQFPLDIYSFTFMPNHWHFGVRPKENGDMGKFFGKFTQRVTHRWHAFHHTAGSGHLFQGRFKSFLIQENSYFLQLMKYIEANPLRANLVDKAEEWKWGSLYLRMQDPKLAQSLLAPWPIGVPKDYIEYVNDVLPPSDLESIRTSLVRNRPFGDILWVKSTSEKFGLRHTLRREGRPNK